MNETGAGEEKIEANFARDTLFASDTLLMGRETYQAFAWAWGSRTAADEEPRSEGFVERINQMPKYVASTTLKNPLDVECPAHQ